MKTIFKVFVTKDVSEHSTFEEAFTSFFDEVWAMVRRGTSWQVLETMCWIEGTFKFADDTKLVAPLHFPDARDFAIDHGLLVQDKGKPSIASPTPQIPPDIVFLKYTEVALTEGVDALEKLRQIRAES